MVVLGGVGSVGAMARALTFQFDRGSLSSLWIGWGLGSLQPVAQAALLAVVVGATLAVRRDDRLRDDLPRLAAILAGVLLLTQFAANYWTWAYLPWAIAPALLVLVPAHEVLQAKTATDWTQVRGQGTKQFSGTY
jgi:cell division protein FtsW (lipid II flippase)